VVADTRTRPRVHRRLLASIAALLGVVLMAGALGVSAYVYPAAAELPARADVIYVIGPPTEGRIALAEQLRRDGIADDILISVPTDGQQSAANLSACQEAWVTCVHPEPFTTAGEMAVLRDEYGTEASAVVITFTPHVSRTRFIADRCAGARVTVVDVPTSLDLGKWIYQFAYQTGGFAKALVVGCP
jgi:hypothetical protein